MRAYARRLTQRFTCCILCTSRRSCSSSASCAPRRDAGALKKSPKSIFSKNSNVVVDVVPFKRPLLEGSCSFWYADLLSLVLADGVLGSDQSAVEAQVMDAATDVAVRLSHAADSNFAEALDLNTYVQQAVLLLGQLDITAHIAFERTEQHSLCVHISTTDPWTAMFEKKSAVRRAQLPTEELRTTFDAAMQSFAALLRERADAVARAAVKDLQCYYAERASAYSFVDGAFRRTKLERVVCLQREGMDSETVACSAVFMDYLRNVTRLTVLTDSISLKEDGAFVCATHPTSFAALLAEPPDKGPGKATSDALMESRRVPLPSAIQFMKLVYEQQYTMHRGATSTFGACCISESAESVLAINYFFFGRLALSQFYDAMEVSTSKESRRKYKPSFFFYKIGNRSRESSCLLIVDLYRFLCGYLCFQFFSLESITPCGSSGSSTYSGSAHSSVSANWWREVDRTNSEKSTTAVLFWPFTSTRKIPLDYFVKHFMGAVPLNLAAEPASHNSLVSKGTEAPPEAAATMTFIDVINVPESLVALGVRTASYEPNSKVLTCFGEDGDQLFVFTHMNRAEGLRRLFKVCSRSPVFVKIGATPSTSSEALAIRLLSATMSGQSNGAAQNLAHYVKKVHVTLPLSSGVLTLSFRTLLERLAFQHAFISMTREFSPNAAEWPFHIRRPRTFFHLWKFCQPLVASTGIEFYFEKRAAEDELVKEATYVLHGRYPGEREDVAVDISSDARALFQVYAFLSKGTRDLEDEVLSHYVPKYVDSSTVTVGAAKDFVHTFLSGHQVVTFSEDKTASLRLEVASEWTIDLASVPAEDKENVKKNLAVSFLKAWFPRVLAVFELQDRLHAHLVQMETLTRVLEGEEAQFSFFVNASESASSFLFKAPRGPHGEADLGKAVELMRAHTEWGSGCSSSSAIDSKVKQLSDLCEKMALYVNFLRVKVAESVAEKKRPHPPLAKTSRSFFRHVARLLSIEHRVHGVYHRYNAEAKEVSIHIQSGCEDAASEAKRLVSVPCEPDEVLHGLVQAYMAALSVPVASAPPPRRREGEGAVAGEGSSAKLARAEANLNLPSPLRHFFSFSQCDGSRWKLTLLLPLALLQVHVVGAADSTPCVQVCFSAATKKGALGLLADYLEQTVNAPFALIQRHTTGALLKVEAASHRRVFVPKSKNKLFRLYAEGDANKVVSSEGNVFQFLYGAIASGAQRVTETRSGTVVIKCSTLLGLAITYEIPAARVASRQRRVKRVNSKVTAVELFAEPWAHALWPPFHILFALVEVYGKLLTDEDEGRASKALMALVQQCTAGICTHDEKAFCVSFFSALCGWPTMVDDGTESKGGDGAIREPVYFRVCVRERSEYAHVFCASVQFVKQDAASNSVFVKEMLSVAEPTKELALSALWTYWTAHILTVCNVPNLQGFDANAIMEAFRKVL